MTLSRNKGNDGSIREGCQRTWTLWDLRGDDSRWVARHKEQNFFGVSEQWHERLGAFSQIEHDEDGGNWGLWVRSITVWVEDGSVEM